MLIVVFYEISKDSVDMAIISVEVKADGYNSVSSFVVLIELSIATRDLNSSDRLNATLSEEKRCYELVGILA